MPAVLHNIPVRRVRQKDRTNGDRKGCLLKAVCTDGRAVVAAAKVDRDRNRAVRDAH